ncbi:flagellin N-terminal helical domain-containing protein [Klenkia terrae]|uniref:flagellin N-terminal helical domain-containing protein n=1 Tax=Klenkia terrae TaxID=1052259 RepID=UPI00296F94F4|nr:flagellin [Klenkia terrae]
MRINTNTAAMNAYRNLSVNDSAMSKSLEKLSSGFRINRAADDAAGLAISEGMKSQIGGLKVAVRNTQDGVSVVQTAEGALATTQGILQRMRDLSVQAANDGGLSTEAKGNIQSEITQLNSELTRIAGTTKFNGKALLDGTYSGTFQVGANAAETISASVKSTGVSGAVSNWANGAAATTAAAATFTLNGVTTTTAVLTASTNANTIATQLNNDNQFKLAYTATVDSLGGLQVKAKDAAATGAITAGGGINAAGTNTAAAAAAGGFSAADLGVAAIDVTAVGGPDAALGLLDKAISAVSTSRASLGAIQNRLEQTTANLNIAVENLTASRSRIVDVDMASEMTEFSKNQILVQAGTSMLAQANQSAQSVLKLLQ